MKREVAAGSTSADMTTVFRARPYGRFIEIQSNLRRKKLRRTNLRRTIQFFWKQFSKRNYVRTPIQFRRESQPQHLKADSSSIKDLSIFISIAPVLLDWSKEIWYYSARFILVP